MFNEKYGFGDFVMFKQGDEWLYGRIECVECDEYDTVWYEIMSGDTLYLCVDESLIVAL